jgi:hypothetical protein
MTIEEALGAHEEDLMNLPGVQGVGIGERGGKQVIKVFIEAKTPETSHFVDQIPAELEGYAVVIEEIGKITPLSAD